MLSSISRLNVEQRPSINIPVAKSPLRQHRFPEQLQRAIMEVVNKLSKSCEVQPRDIRSIDQLGNVSMEHKIHLRRGKWRRYSEEMEQRITASENAE